MGAGSGLSGFGFPYADSCLSPSDPKSDAQLEITNIESCQSLHSGRTTALLRILESGGLEIARMKSRTPEVRIAGEACAGNPKNFNWIGGE